jgi:hypothetical protein
MALKKQWNYFDFDSTGFLRKSGKTLPDKRMYAGLKLLAFGRVAEYLVRNPTALICGNYFMDDVIGVKGLRAEFVEVVRKQRLSACDASGKGNAHCHLILSMHSSSLRFVAPLGQKRPGAAMDASNILIAVSQSPSAI